MNSDTNPLFTSRLLFALPIVSGALLALPFFFGALWPIAFVGLVPFIVFIRLFRGSARALFMRGFAGGLVYMGGVIAWFLNAAPAEWAGISEPAIGWLLVGAVWLVAAVILALCIGLWSLAAKYMQKRDFGDIIVVPALFVVFEYARAFFFSIVSAGSLDSTLVGAHWSQGFLGYAVSGNDIILQGAAWGGVYFLSFIGATVNVGIAHAFFSSWKRGVASVILVGILLAASGFRANAMRDTAPAPDQKEQGFVAAAIHTEFPSFFRLTDEAFAQRGKAMEEIITQTADAYKPALIALPEDARFLFYLNGESDVFAERAFGDREVLLIDSARTETREDVFSVAYSWNTKRESVNYQFKNFLVPAGEFLPYLISIPLSLFGGESGRDAVLSFSRGRGYTRGKSLGAAPFMNTSTGVLFCSEIFSPQLYRRLVREKSAGILVNVASQSVFSGKQLDKQIIQMARVRAVETGRYFIRSGNATPSFILDPRGNIIAWKESLAGAAVGTVFPRTDQTPYVRFGPWVVGFSFAVIFHSLWRTRMRARTVHGSVLRAKESDSFEA